MVYFSRWGCKREGECVVVSDKLFGPLCGGFGGPRSGRCYLALSKTHQLAPETAPRDPREGGICRGGVLGPENLLRLSRRSRALPHRVVIPNTIGFIDPRGRT